MRQIIERLSMLTTMRDEMVEQITQMGEVDCESPAFRDIDDAIKCLDTHHIHRLRVSLDLGEEIPLSRWLSAIREGRPILTPEQAVKLLSRATDRMEKAFEGLVDKAIATHDLHEAAKFSGQRNVWDTDPAVPMPHFSVEKSGREEREKASGIVIDPGGTCLCRRCGKGVSALYDHCDNCCAPITWNA